MWPWTLPVVEQSLPDLDGAQLLDTALKTHGHVGVWDAESLSLPSAAAGGEAMSRGGGVGAGGRVRHLLYQSYLPAGRLERLLIHKLVVLRSKASSVR